MCVKKKLIKKIPTKKWNSPTYFLPHMEQESAVAQIQCMKSRVAGPVTELIVCVCDVRACGETWGRAGSLLSLQTDWWSLFDVVERGRLQAESLCHTLTPSETLFFFFSFPQTPTYQFCSSGESGCLFSNIALRICQGYSPELLFRKWKNEMVMLIMLGGSLINHFSLRWTKCISFIFII